LEKDADAQYRVYEALLGFRDLWRVKKVAHDSDAGQVISG